MPLLRIQRAQAHRILGFIFSAALSITAACEDTSDDPTDAGSNGAGKDANEGGKSGSAGSAGKAGSGAKAGSGGAAGKDESDAGLNDDDAGPPGLPKKFKITFSTSECFGACPVYTVSLDQAGQVVFDGKKNVDQEGKSEKKVSATAAAEVYEALVEAGYFELKDKYRTEADGCERWRTDSSTHNWSVERDGQTKALSHYLGCEGVAALDQVLIVSKLLRETAEISEWIGE